MRGMSAQRFLKDSMSEARITQELLARAMGLKGASSVQRYLGEEYKSKPYPLNTARKMADALESHGLSPDNRSAVISALAGVGEIAEKPLPVLMDGKVQWLDELDVQASMGPGIVAGPENVIAKWGIPVADMPHAQGPVYVITAIGDSMVPTVLPGQKVAIDTGHTVPSPGGIYAIHDGDALTLKRVERDMGAADKTYIVSSDNRDSYREFRLQFEEQTAFTICGRMLATWQWA